MVAQLVDGHRAGPDGSAGGEEGSDVAGEELRFLGRREVAAAGMGLHRVTVVEPLEPLPWRAASQGSCWSKPSTPLGTALVRMTPMHLNASDCSSMRS